jgi:uncharacterized membrane protein YvbJ
MNCPKCKNPIADDSQECEWCGVKINKPNTQKKDSNSNKSNKETKKIITSRNQKEENNSWSWGCLFLIIFLFLMIALISDKLKYTNFFSWVK